MIPLSALPMVVATNSGLVYQSLPNVYNITDSFTFAAIQSCYQSPSIATHVCQIISYHYAALITVDNLTINGMLLIEYYS
jgi:hypothetical protein